jgi:hypothetical protein
MDLLDYSTVPFGSDMDMGRVCKDLYYITGAGIRYDTFTITNNKRLWLVKNIVAAMNSNKVLCGAFGLYPSFVDGVLRQKK